MATEKSWAQEIIECDSCDNPALRVCKSCETNLCIGCIPKHLHELDSSSHDIVSFKYKTSRVVFPDCEFHQGQKCEGYCQLCHIQVCTKCLIGPHKGHDAEELIDFIKRKKQEIETETEEIKNKLIPEWKSREEEMKAKLLDLEEMFCNQEQEINYLKDVWHKKVDDIFIAASSLIRSNRDDAIAISNSTQVQQQKIISDMSGKVKENNQIMRTNKASNFINYRSKLMEYRDVTTNTEVKCPLIETNNVSGKELCIKINNFRATLSHTSNTLPSASFFLNKVGVTAKIPTVYTNPFRVSCVGTEKALVHGNSKSIIFIDILGNVLDEFVTTCQYMPQDISVTDEQNPMYSNSSKGTVNIIRNGKSEKLFSVQKNWEPLGLCCTKSGHVLVNICKNKKHKVVRYQGLQITQEIYKDEHEKNLIFKKGEAVLLLSENNNGDTCVSDPNAGKVVAVESTGRVRFRYDGTMAKMKKTFEPRCIVTDAHCHIVVTDMNNDCLHIIDQHGNLMKYLDGCGLYGPSGLSIDAVGRLWVGLPIKKEIKVIEYLK